MQTTFFILSSLFIEVTLHSRWIFNFPLPIISIHFAQNWNSLIPFQKPKIITSPWSIPSLPFLNDHFPPPPPISKTVSFATSCLPHSQPFSRASVACASNAEHTVSLLSHRIAVPPTRITEFLRVVKRDELSSRRRNAIIEFKKWCWK